MYLGSGVVFPHGFHTEITPISVCVGKNLILIDMTGALQQEMCT